MRAHGGPRGAMARGASNGIHRAKYGVGDILRSRRERLRPSDVGIPAGLRRRTPGLRREEVALLAGVTVTYYTYIEQGRQMHPSKQVLDALARALLMNDAEREHLNALADRDGATAPAQEQLSPGVEEMVQRLDPHPTYVLGCALDVLASNRAANALFTEWSAKPAHERNLLMFLFTDPHAREVYLDWEHEAYAALARFRAAMARHQDDERFDHLAEQLHARSAEVRAWWPRHEVAATTSAVTRLRHPALGDVALRGIVLGSPTCVHQRLVTFDAVPGSDVPPLERLLAAPLNA